MFFIKEDPAVSHNDFLQSAQEVHEISSRPYTLGEIQLKILQAANRKEDSFYIRESLLSEKCKNILIEKGYKIKKEKSIFSSGFLYEISWKIEKQKEYEKLILQNGSVIVIDSISK